MTVTLINAETGQPETCTYRDVFQTPYDQYSELNGLPFTVVNVIEHATDLYGGIDEESCPMFRVNVGGQTITAWPEEVLEDD